MTTRKTRNQKNPRAPANPGARRGGQARAAVLTAAERSGIAREAVLVRWRKKKGENYQPPAPHTPGRLAVRKSGVGTPRGDRIPLSLFQGRLRIGQLELECHVLSDGRRVFSQGPPGAHTKRTRGVLDLKAFLSGVTGLWGEGEHSPDVQYLAPKARAPVTGYEATYLVDVANAYLKARDRGTLTAVQVPFAKHAEVITRSLAKVGITALIDSVTGFEHVRLKRALELSLMDFIADDIQEWAHTFPEEFWSELARLEGIRYSPRSRPLRWGRYVMLFVYDAIDQDVENRLTVTRPDVDFREDHRRWLESFSKEQLNRHLREIVSTMKRCRTMNEFRAKLDRVFSRVPAEVGIPKAS